MNSRFIDIHNIPMRELSKAYGRASDTRTPRRERQKGATPKFFPTDVIGELTIKSYVGYSTVHPEKATILSGEHHWYRVECSCGLTEVRSQQQLVDKRRKQQCSTCARKSK